MKKKYTVLWFGLISSTLVAMYIIWPLPFRYLSRKVLVPTLEVTNSVSNWIKSPIKTMTSISSLDNKNKELEKENNSLKSEISQLKEELTQSTKQIDEVEKIPVDSPEFIQAKVIGRTSLSFNQKIVINVGASQGIRHNATVIYQGYYLGKVTELDNSSSVVKLVTSYDSLVPVMTQDSRQSGIIQGGLQGLTITDVPINGEIKDGEMVVTSGLGGDLVSGIPVGNIKSVRTENQELFKQVEVSYPINANKIEVVSVSKDG